MSLPLLWNIFGSFLRRPGCRLTLTTSLTRLWISPFCVPMASPDCVGGGWAPVSLAPKAAGASHGGCDGEYQLNFCICLNSTVTSPFVPLLAAEMGQPRHPGWPRVERGVQTPPGAAGVCAGTAGCAWRRGRWPQQHRDWMSYKCWAPSDALRCWTGSANGVNVLGSLTSQAVGYLICYLMFPCWNQAHAL